MTKKHKYLILLGIAGLAVIAALVYSLLWGKLFPYSPVSLGFTCEELEHIVLCVEDGNKFRGFEWIDGLLDRVEDSHELRFKSKPRIFLFSRDETYAARSISKARLCEFYNGAIVVSPWVQQEDADGLLSLKVYLVHELSHSLLHQNMNLLRALSYPRWLLEGVATFSADQFGTFVYPGQAETMALIAQGNWMPPDYFSTSDEDQVSLQVEHRMPFVYCQFACIVGDLRSRFGRDRFLTYVKELLTDRDHDQVFLKTFGLSFEDYLKDFRTRAGQSQAANS